MYINYFSRDLSTFANYWFSMKDSLSTIAMNVCKYSVCCIISPKHIIFWGDFSFSLYKPTQTLQVFLSLSKSFLVAKACRQYEHFLKNVFIKSI